MKFKYLIDDTTIEYRWICQNSHPIKKKREGEGEGEGEGGREFEGFGEKLSFSKILIVTLV